MVSFQCDNIIIQNGDFCSISPFVLKYLLHPVFVYFLFYTTGST